MSDQEIEEEEKRLNDFVKSHPYPSFDEMTKNLENKPQLWSEYSIFMHNCCKTIYENPTDEDVIVKEGKKLYNFRGIFFLQICNIIVKHYSPYAKSSDSAVNSQGRMIEFHFMNVTPEWQA